MFIDHQKLPKHTNIFIMIVFKNNLFFYVFIVIQFCYSQSIPIVVSDDYTERTFNGIGAISGGGATSKLLLNYPQTEQNDILNLLFKPSFGASLQILKVEIGGDGQSSEGCESSHMHEEWDENYSRGYEWWLMAEAKKRNPAIKLYGLPWVFPSWVSDFDPWNAYKNVNKTAKYVANWILGAKREHNLDIDYIGIWNEKPYVASYIETLRAMLDSNGLHSVQIVAADMINSDAWDISKDLLTNTQLNASVDIVGGHYVGTFTTSEAQQCGKPLWASESGGGAQSTTLGAGCLARIINQNYVNGYMTSTISWNLITAYYDHIYADRKGLMMANQPWSGHYEVSPPVWAVAHTTQFTDIGWKYLAHGQGVDNLPAGGSMVTLASPDRKHFTIVFETMNVAKYDFCLELPQSSYEVSTQNVTLILNGNLQNIHGFYIWQTYLDLEDEENSVYFQRIGFLKNYNGVFSLNLKVNSIYTLTTLNRGTKGTVTNIPNSGEFPKIYEDNYDAYPNEQEPFNLVSQTGMFEVGKSSDHRKVGKIVRQVVQHRPILWCPYPLFQPIAIIGNYSWTDVKFSVDVFLPAKIQNTTSGVFIAARIDKTGCEVVLTRGIFFYLMFDEQKAQISTDLGKIQVLFQKSVELFWSVWYTLSLRIKDNRITAVINNSTIFDEKIKTLASNGFVGFGTYDFGLAEYDNLYISAA